MHTLYEFDNNGNAWGFTYDDSYCQVWPRPTYFGKLNDLLNQGWTLITHEMFNFHRQQVIKLINFAPNLR